MPKTKVVFFPSTLTLKKWRCGSETNDIANDIANDDELINLIPNRINLLKSHENAAKTKPFAVNSNENVFFTDNFYCLGSILDFLLDDASDMKLRISKADKAIGALNFIWVSQQLSLESKIKLFLAIPVNLALWNCETWS